MVERSTCATARKSNTSTIYLFESISQWAEFKLFQELLWCRGLC
uniref:Uncharacterized protein n=1 Tax=Arundo donax TaxID=35708 RepID=A0A0A9HJU9_ARUDO